MSIESAIHNARSLVVELREFGPILVSSDLVEALEGQITRLEQVVAEQPKDYPEERS